MIEVQDLTVQALNISLMFSLSNLLFFGLIIGLILTKGHLVFQVGLSALGAIIVLVAFSALAPMMLCNSIRDRAAVSFTTAVRNLSLALLLSSTFFGRREGGPTQAFRDW